MTETPGAIARIETDQGTQERIWRASRAAWWCMGAVLLAASAGLFGEGPLAERESTADDGSLRVVFERFQRADATTALELHAARRPADGALRFCLSHDFLGEWRVMRTEPEPLEQRTAADAVCSTVLVDADAAQPRVRLWVQPRLPSLHATGTVRLDGAAPVPVRAVVWP